MFICFCVIRCMLLQLMFGKTNEKRIKKTFIGIKEFWFFFFKNHSSCRSYHLMLDFSYITKNDLCVMVTIPQSSPSRKEWDMKKSMVFSAHALSLWTASKVDTIDQPTEPTEPIETTNKRKLLHNTIPFKVKHADKCSTTCQHIEQI